MVEIKLLLKTPEKRNSFPLGKVKQSELRWVGVYQVFWYGSSRAGTIGYGPRIAYGAADNGTSGVERNEVRLM